MGINRTLYPQSLFLILLLVILLVKLSSITSYFWSNLAWAQLTEITLLHRATEAPTDYFTNALRADSTNSRAHFGAGMAYAIVYNDRDALNQWQKIAVQPWLLIQLGQQMQNRELWDAVFVYFRSAGQLEMTTPGRGDFLAGRLCQQMRVQITLLSPANQLYCEDYFDDNDGNLLLDGSFEHAIGWAWLGTHFFHDISKATINLDSLSGIPAPSLVVTGLVPGRHAGIYQTVAIAPGTTVRFSGYFRSEDGTDEAEPSLLYVEWRQTGQIQGNHLEDTQTDMNWTYLERIFTLPHDSESWAHFYPVLLEGAGPVWVDNIRVEILSQ